MTKTLLLSCCAPCSCAVIQKMAADGIDFAVVFYNPNIQPAEEYEKRRAENEKFCRDRGVSFITLEYDPENWRGKVRGMEAEPERGRRCSVCFLMRLRRVAEYARQNGFDTITSVLGVSRHKDFNQATEAGRQVAAEYGLVYDETNWRKGGLEQLRQRLVRESGMYAQDYCGCPFSKRKPE